MECLHCENDNTTDYPVCNRCAPEFHFTDRAVCLCDICQARRERERLAAIAWEEELKLYYGFPVQAAA